MNTKIALWLSWVGFVAFAAGMGYAQVTRNANDLVGCLVTTGVTATAGQVVPLTCDTTGKLRTGAA